MPIPSTMSDLSPSAASNSPLGSEAIGNGLDNYLRAVQAIIRSTNHKGSDLASAASVAIGASAGEFLTITGTTTITSFDNVSAGIVRTVLFTGALTLAHSANLQMPGNKSYVTNNPEVLTFRSLGSGQWVCASYTAYGLAKTSTELLQGGSQIVTAGSISAFIRGVRVRATGQLDKSLNGMTVSKIGTGAYRVTHNFNLIDARNIIANASMDTDVGFISVGSFTANYYEVYTYDTAGAAADKAFHSTCYKVE